MSSSHLTYVSDAEWEVYQEMLKLMGYTLGPEQEEIVRCNNRTMLVTGGEQAGKSYVAGAYLLPRLPGSKLFWLVGDDYEQCQTEFKNIIDALALVGVVNEKSVSMPQKGAWSATVLNGIKIKTKTAADVRKLAREAPDGIIMCEAAQMGYDIYQKLLGRTAPKRAWLLMVGTLEASMDWYAQFFARWQSDNPEKAVSFCLPSWANRHLYPGGREDPEIKRIEANLDPETFMMRFAAKPYPPENMIFRAFNFGIHVPGDVKFDPEVEVQLWIDPGFSGSKYAIEVVQLVDGDKHCDKSHVHFIDELYEMNRATPEMIDMCNSRDWYENIGLVVIDIAGTQQTSIGVSVSEQWAAEGFAVAAQHIGIEDGISRHRTFLKDPATGQARLFFANTCVGAFTEYGRWKRRKIADGVNQTAKAEVTNCDAMKAINYGLVENFGYTDVEMVKSVIRSPFS